LAQAMAPKAQPSGRRERARRVEPAPASAAPCEGPASEARVPTPTRAVPSPAHLLLDWYDRERRDLPWRFAPGQVADPYRVWLSEIMLQQTTVATVVPYFTAFVERWPTIETLAAADLDEVLGAWSGLGYYSRARNLHACARRIVGEHGGRFPRTEAELSRLPGIGRYTAAAIAAIAFGQQATPVDGNVERVVARYCAIETLLPTAKPEIARRARQLTPDYRAGDFAQAMMDLGASICAPRRPSCLMCPLAAGCEARARGLENDLPRRRPRPERPTRRGVAFVALREDGYILLRRRPASGLLGGMLEVPSTDWRETWPSMEEAVQRAPVRADWLPAPGSVIHTFTHFRLDLMVLRAVVPVDVALDLFADAAQCRWVARDRLAAEALPTVMRKVVSHAFEHGIGDGARDRATPARPRRRRREVAKEVGADRAAETEIVVGRRGSRSRGASGGERSARENRPIRSPRLP
jgi:A/G-specific adenine glycosylase